MEAKSREIILYSTVDGKSPFIEWQESLKDPKTRTIIDKAVDKISRGLLTQKNSRSVGSGVSEFKDDSGSGYRLYFGQVSSIVVLLCGGDKSTQDQDIQKAKVYWADYEERESTNQ